MAKEEDSLATAARLYRESIRSQAERDRVRLENERQEEILKSQKLSEEIRTKVPILENVLMSLAEEFNVEALGGKGKIEDWKIVSSIVQDPGSKDPEGDIVRSGTYTCTRGKILRVRWKSTSERSLSFALITEKAETRNPRDYYLNHLQYDPVLELYTGATYFWRIQALGKDPADVVDYARKVIIHDLSQIL